MHEVRCISIKVKLAVVILPPKPNLVLVCIEDDSTFTIIAKAGNALAV